MEKNHRFPYEWELSKANFTKDKGKVFSCFACGGGSTMGYKLAGFDVIGCNEIDPKMFNAYVENHNPKFPFLEPIQTFKNREDLPKELFELDILDGSPPCSSFSMSGNREKDWSKEKKFKEGQAKQVLDTLFFDFIDLAKRLQPKVVVAENVKGLMMGNAREYVRKIYRQFDEAGYYGQHFLLSSNNMGVPQRRERVFFICLRKDLSEQFLKQIDIFTIIPELKLIFKEKDIVYGEIECGDSVENYEKITPCDLQYFDECKPGDSISSVHPKGNRFNSIKMSPTKVVNTIAAGSCLFHYSQKRKLTKRELCLAGTYPLDYDFKTNKPIYLIGMSVPPVMVAQIATEIYNQWLSKL